MVPDALVMLLIRVLKTAVRWMELRSASVSVHRGLESLESQNSGPDFHTFLVVHGMDHGMLTSVGLFP